ncbi:hypothetical protein E2C01_008910 [Portunus trituberculatus]|uniref:EGF-like domain-containing protein n=1 Tax=Portunus trituberculatus TaxID=210409 RepID=A0A5B7D566_PORTR|nr:hypothetical protein [Portunus trituberculatus]
MNKACIRNKCVDPCSDVCGQDALCEVINHSPICYCPKHLTGDPFIHCVKRESNALIFWKEHQIHHNPHVKETLVGPMPSVGKWAAHEDAPVCLDSLAIHHPVGLSVWCQASALHSLPVSSTAVLILVEAHVVSKPSVKLSTIIQSAVVSQALPEIPSFAAPLPLL